MANINPIYSKEGSIAWDVLTSANTATDGTGTVSTIFTAGSNGSRVEYVMAQPAGTNVATVLRIFINNGSTNTTAANNTLFRQVGLAATTASATVGQLPIIVPMNLVLPSGYKINVVIATTVAAGWAVTAVGGNY